MTDNPFQPPMASLAAPDILPALDDAEAIRRAHIKHEASVKSIGVLYYLGAFFQLLAGAFSLVGLLSMFRADGANIGMFELAVGLSVPMILLGLGALQLVTAYGLRRLRSWSRVIAVILCILGVMGNIMPLFLGGMATVVPLIVIMITCYILYLLLCKKGRVIFSPEYQQVISATPHVKYKTSIVVWVFVAILVALLVTGILAAIAGF